MWRRLAVLLCLFGVFLGGAVAVVKARVTTRREAHFTSARWKRPVAFCEHSSRERMAHDLVTNHLERGLSRSRVRAFLGAPDIADGTVWLYNVGKQDDWLGMDYCLQLEVTFGRGGLSNAQVYSSS
jgi:hypothetical protein